MEKKMLRQKLEETFESFWETTKGFFYSEEEVASFIFIIGVKAGRLAVLAAVPLSEGIHKFPQSIPLLCKKFNAVAGIVVGKAWMARLKHDEIVLEDIVPSKRPDRIEVLQVTLVSKVLNKVRAWKMIREGKKHLEPLGDDDMIPIYSKFFGDYFNMDVPKSEGKEIKN